MKGLSHFVPAFAATTIVAFVLLGQGKSVKACDVEPKLAHCVYFTLKESSPAARAKLVGACRQYLSGHPGTIYFAAGTIEEGLKREVNDRAFDVSLIIIFKTKADQDRYQDAPLHHQFIKENKDNWKKVRVFDSRIE